MKKIITVFAAIALAMTAIAQTSLKVQAPDLVGVNEQFNVTFIISGENSPSDFNWDPGSDFQLVWGPQKGTSTSVTVINGNRSRSSQTTYTYVLMPKGTGRFQLPAAEAVVKGSKYVSGRPTIEVVSDNSAASSRSQSQGSQSQDQSDQESAGSSSVSANDMFMRLTLSKRSAMVGEPITATLKLYQRVNIAGFEDAKFPTFNGFWSQEMQSPSNIEFHRENVGDKIYNAAVLRSWNLVPQQAGDIKIDAAELVCLVNVRSQKNSTGSIFDSFFQDDYQTIRKRVSTSPVTVHVTRLPAGAPASFGGGVGSFNMSAELTKNSLQAHDAASLKITVTGTGNVALLGAPKVNFPPDFDVYDVKSSDITGGKVFEFPFIPRSAGDFTIEPVEYSYFDIGSRKYVTLKSQPLDIKVAKGSGNGSNGGNGNLIQGASRKDVQDIGSDIRYIHTEKPVFSSAHNFFVGSTGFWIIVALLLLAAAGLYLFFTVNAAMRADIAGSKNRAATKMARKRLSQAGVFLNKNLYSAFYEELHRALLGYVSDKFNMSASDMTRDNISARLLECGVNSASAEDFLGLIDACEYARYSPDSGHEAMNAHYESAVSVISSIDESMKRQHKPSAGAAAVILALLMLIPSNSRAAGTSYADSLWAQGVKAYSEGRWNVAAESWTSIKNLNLASPQLYYNLGNAYFKYGDYAHAIINYQRALKLNPSYPDAKSNLEFARSMTEDKIDAVPEFFLKTWYLDVCSLLSSNAWTALMLVFLALTLAMVLLFLLGQSTPARKTGFISGIVCLLLTAAFLSFAFTGRSDYQNADSAVITRAVTSVKSSPGESSAKDLFILHEGTEVKLLDEVGTWRNIELADGRQGWINSADLEVI